MIFSKTSILAILFAIFELPAFIYAGQVNPNLCAAAFYSPFPDTFWNQLSEGEKKYLTRVASDLIHRRFILDGLDYDNSLQSPARKVESPLDIRFVRGVDHTPTIYRREGDKNAATVIISIPIDVVSIDTQYDLPVKLDPVPQKEITPPKIVPEAPIVKTVNQTPVVQAPKPKVFKSFADLMDYVTQQNEQKSSSDSEVKQPEIPTFIFDADKIELRRNDIPLYIRITDATYSYEDIMKTVIRIRLSLKELERYAGLELEHISALKEISDKLSEEFHTADTLSRENIAGYFRVLADFIEANPRSFNDSSLVNELDVEGTKMLMYFLRYENALFSLNEGSLVGRAGRALLYVDETLQIIFGKDLKVEGRRLKFDNKVAKDYYFRQDIYNHTIPAILEIFSSHKNISLLRSDLESIKNDSRITVSRLLNAVFDSIRKNIELSDEQMVIAFGASKLIVNPNTLQKQVYKDAKSLISDLSTTQSYRGVRIPVVLSNVEFLKSNKSWIINNNGTVMNLFEMIEYRLNHFGWVVELQKFKSKYNPPYNISDPALALQALEDFHQVFWNKFRYESAKIKDALQVLKRVHPKSRDWFTKDDWVSINTNIYNSSFLKEQSFQGVLDGSSELRAINILTPELFNFIQGELR